MKQPAKILVPVDLSKRSELAVEYAAMMAERFEAEIVLAININLPERALLEEFANGEGITIEAAAEGALRRLASSHAGNCPSSVVVRFDDFVAEGILHAVEVAEADLIVIGSHGRSGFSRWTLGSVAEKIVRTAPVPVVVVPVRS